MQRNTTNQHHNKQRNRSLFRKHTDKERMPQKPQKRNGSCHKKITGEERVVPQKKNQHERGTGRANQRRSAGLRSSNSLNSPSPAVTRKPNSAIVGRSSNDEPASNEGSSFVSPFTSNTGMSSLPTTYCYVVMSCIVRERVINQQA